MTIAIALRALPFQACTHPMRSALHEEPNRSVERKNEYFDVLRRLVPPLPPEPLRWLAITGLMSILNAVDARVDRQIRAQQGRT